MPQTRATGLSYSGHKYITGEMRGRFCANPADTDRRQAKRRRHLGAEDYLSETRRLGTEALPSENEA